MIDCPHCFLRVIPMKGGVCPSCHGDTTVARTDGRQLLEVTEKANLPKLCCTCAKSCERQIRLKSIRSIQGEKVIRQDAGELSLAFLWFFLGWFSLALKFASSMTSSRDGREVVVEVLVPQCLACSNGAPLEPIRVDYDFFRMDLAVAREFADEFRKLNPRSS
jgi:hypothetical protein